MIKIHATKKLLTKLPVDEQGILPPDKNAPPQQGNTTDHSESLLSGWHANLITLQRRNCILFVHDVTRFPVFIPCLTKPDFAAVDWYFQDAFMNTLLKIGADDAMMNLAGALLQPLCFDTNCNRSVQGIMSQIAGDIEHSINFRDVNMQDFSPYRMSAWLADRPCNIKGQKDCVWPIKAMSELLGRSIEPTQTLKSEPNMESIGGTEIIQLSRFKEGTNKWWF
tara:strand:- start:908 stop:1576 length:669 start_codon:yes stop_codon:yes gene_type:complete